MKNSFFQAVCRTGIFMICAQAIVHFRPNASYEKYLKLLMSIMVLIQLIVPIGSFFMRGGGARTAELLERFEKDLEAGMEEAEKNALEADRLLEQMTLEEVRRRAVELEKEAGSETRGEEGTGTQERTGTQEKPGTQERTGTQEKPGAAEKSGQGGAGAREEIRIELEGIEPVKIGQEE